MEGRPPPRSTLLHRIAPPLIDHFLSVESLSNNDPEVGFGMMSGASRLGCCAGGECGVVDSYFLPVWVWEVSGHGGALLLSYTSHALWSSLT